MFDESITIDTVIEYYQRTNKKLEKVIGALNELTSNSSLSNEQRKKVYRIEKEIHELSKEIDDDFKTDIRKVQ